MCVQVRKWPPVLRGNNRRNGGEPTTGPSLAWFSARYEYFVFNPPHAISREAAETCRMRQRRSLFSLVNALTPDGSLAVPPRSSPVCLLLPIWCDEQEGKKGSSGQTESTTDREQPDQIPVGDRRASHLDPTEDSLRPCGVMGSSNDLAHPGETLFSSAVRLFPTFLASQGPTSASPTTA